MSPAEQHLRLQFLRSTSVFHALEPDLLHRIAERSFTRSYPRKTQLTNDTSVALVIEGMLRVSACSPVTGKRVIFLLLAPGEPFNLLRPFTMEPRHIIAETMTEATLLEIPGEWYHQLLKEEPGFACAVLGCVAPNHDRSLGRILDLLEQEVKVRVARALAFLFEKFGDNLSLGSVEIAELAETTPESTLRVMARLRKEGAISYSRLSISLLDSVVLEQFCAAKQAS